jgi:hypothetical protein
VTGHPSYSADRPTAGCQDCTTCNQRCACPGCTAPTVQLVRMGGQPNRAGSTSEPCPTCRSFMNHGGYCPDQWHRPVAAQPSPDLPDDDEEFATPDVGYPTASDLALVAFATGSHHGAISVEYVPVPDEGDDLYRAVAAVYATIRYPINTAEDPARALELAERWAARTDVRAAIDEAVRLTEQRVRAEIGADPETCPVDHTCDEEGPCGCWCELHDCPIADCPTYQLVTAWLDRAAADLAAMTARAEAAEALLRDHILDLDPPDDVAPETGLSSTETGVQATVDGQDANGPQGGSGGGTP